MAPTLRPGFPTWGQKKGWFPAPKLGPFLAPGCWKIRALWALKTKVLCRVPCPVSAPSARVPECEGGPHARQRAGAIYSTTDGPRWTHRALVLRRGSRRRPHSYLLPYSTYGACPLKTQLRHLPYFAPLSNRARVCPGKLLLPNAGVYVPARPRQGQPRNTGPLAERRAQRLPSNVALQLHLPVLVPEDRQAMCGDARTMQLLQQRSCPREQSSTMRY